MSFAGVILVELGYDGETVRQHEFEGKQAVFDDIVAAPDTIEQLKVALEFANKEVDRLRAFELAVEDFWTYINGAPIEAYFKKYLKEDS